MGSIWGIIGAEEIAGNEGRGPGSDEEDLREDRAESNRAANRHAFAAGKTGFFPNRWARSDRGARAVSAWSPERYDVGLVRATED